MNHALPMKGSKASKKSDSRMKPQIQFSYTIIRVIYISTQNTQMKTIVNSAVKMYQKTSSVKLMNLSISNLPALAI